MTLNGHTTLYCTMVRLVELATEIKKKLIDAYRQRQKCRSSDSTFRWYCKVHADIYGGSVARGASNNSGVVRTGDFFCNFGRHILGTFRVVTNIIMQRHEVPYRLSSDPKMLDLE